MLEIKIVFACDVHMPHDCFSINFVLSVQSMPEDCTEFADVGDTITVHYTVSSDIVTIFSVASC